MLDDLCAWKPKTQKFVFQASGFETFSVFYKLIWINVAKNWYILNCLTAVFNAFVHYEIPTWKMRRVKMLNVFAGHSIGLALASLRQASETMATGWSAILCKPMFTPMDRKTSMKVRILILRRQESFTFMLAGLEKKQGSRSRCRIKSAAHLAFFGRPNFEIAYLTWSYIR